MSQNTGGNKKGRLPTAAWPFKSFISKEDGLGWGCFCFPRGTCGNIWLWTLSRTAGGNVNLPASCSEKVATALKYVCPQSSNSTPRNSYQGNKKTFDVSVSCNDIHHSFGKNSKRWGPTRKPNNKELIEKCGADARDSH
uniref:Uncharacterized protein n=1 Tax=Rousettus aegyptiacus TaxID=9407 RepID=A0A7J8H1F2_ROUAE|nr:hypothetical protein HJG63_011191 [Rousettus aegyptiacus]